MIQKFARNAAPWSQILWAKICRFEGNWMGIEMKIKLFMSIAVVVMGLLAVQLPVKAEKVCLVTDPTDSPLNVRDRPNGEIVNALKNGREVYIHEIAIDEQNRSWAKVGGYYEGEYRIWGWVFREFISCYER